MNSYKKVIVGLAILSTMLVSASPALMVAEAAPSSSVVKNAKAQQQKTFADLEKKMQKAAQDMMRQLAGKDIELHTVVELPDKRILIRAKDNPEQNNVTIDTKTGKVVHAKVQLSFADLGDAMQQQALDALRKMEPDKTFTFNKVVRDYYDDGSKAGLLTTKFLGKGVNVQIVNDKLKHADIVYGIDQVDGKIVKAAEKAMKTFSGSDIKFTKAARQQDASGNDQWILEAKNAAVGVGTQTGKVWAVSNFNDGPLNVSDNKVVKKFKEQDVLKATSSYAPIFGLDLKGYKVKKDEVPFVFELTKKDAPSVSVTMGKNKKIYGMSVSPVKGGAK